MVPRISVKVKGEWVPFETLTTEQKDQIRKKVGEAIQTAAERQIRLMIQREKDMARAAN